MKLTVRENFNKTDLKSSVIELAAALLLHVSFWTVLISMCGNSIWKLPLIAAVVMTILAYALDHVRIFTGKTIYYVLLATAVVLLIRYRFLSGGMLILINDAGNAYNALYGFEFVPFETGIAAADVPTARLAAEQVLMGVTGTVFASGIRHKRIVLIFLTACIPACVGLLLRLNPSYPALGIFLAALIYVLLLCMSGEKMSVRLCAAAAAVLILMTSVTSVYPGLKGVQNVQKSAAEKISDWRYAPKTTAEGMPNGDLNNAGTLQYDGSVVFNIKMEHPSAAYLRSFAGDTFENGAWKPLSEAAYTGEYNGINQWLSEYDFYPWLQLGKLYEMDSQRTGSAARTGKIYVENVGAESNKIYAPYEALKPSGVSVNDMGVYAPGLRGERKYTLESYAPLYTDYGSADLASWKQALAVLPEYEEYEKAEKTYRSFVYQNYLSVPQKYDSMLLGTGIMQYTGTRYQDTVYAVRRFLNDNYQYSDSVTHTPGKDPLLDFAENTHSGYDAQFSTLAVLMFRKAGIPARYMEGWYLSSEEMEIYEDNEDAELEVYDSAAHAWVEIYVDGIGWVPVEATPGYFSLDQQQSQSTTEQSQKVSRKDDDTYFDDAQAAAQQQETPNQKKATPWWVWLIVGISAAILLAVLTIVIWNAYLRSRIKKADSAESTLLGFKYLTHRLKHKGYPTGEERAAELAAVLGQTYEKYHDLVLKERYSAPGTGLSPEERRYASDYVLNTVRKSQRLKSSFDRGYRKKRRRQ